MRHLPPPPRDVPPVVGGQRITAAGLHQPEPLAFSRLPEPVLPDLLSHAAKHTRRRAEMRAGTRVHAGYAVGMKVHQLKTWEPYFSAVIDGSKPFEVRRDDRGFQRGDHVRLVETAQQDGEWLPTGRAAQYMITYVLPGGQFGIKPGYVVLGLGSGD